MNLTFQPKMYDLLDAPNLEICWMCYHESVNKNIDVNYLVVRKLKYFLLLKKMLPS